MKLSLCPQPLYKLGLKKALSFMAESGFDAFELPVDLFMRLDPYASVGAKVLERAAAAGGSLGNAASTYCDLVLVERVQARGEPEGDRILPVDRLVEVARSLSDLHWRLAEGPDGRGRARTGLAIARWVIEQHGGRTGASSAGVGEGSEFVVECDMKFIGELSNPKMQWQKGQTASS